MQYICAIDFREFPLFLYIIIINILLLVVCGVFYLQMHCTK